MTSPAKESAARDHFAVIVFRSGHCELLACTAEEAVRWGDSWKTSVRDDTLTFAIPGKNSAFRTDSVEAVICRPMDEMDKLQRELVTLKMRSDLRALRERDSYHDDEENL